MYAWGGRSKLPKILSKSSFSGELENLCKISTYTPTTLVEKTVQKIVKNNCKKSLQKIEHEIMQNMCRKCAKIVE